MQNSVFKKVELVGTSPDQHFGRHRQRHRSGGFNPDNLTWFEVQELRGQVENGKVSSYQVVLKVGFRLNT